MTKILLVRHGEAAKGAAIPDPELTELGHRQAQDLARRLAPQNPYALVSSPKLRARQTALPLSKTWQRPIREEASVTEIPSPEHIVLAERLQWIRALLVSEWDRDDPQQRNWRDGITRYLLQLEEDTAIFCHFMVINSVIAYIRGDSKVQQFRPDYTSVTELKLAGDRLEIVRLGKEKTSRIL